MSGSCVALIRGINVGRAKRVGMPALRALIAEQGYENVRTLLQSGNVVFRAPGIEPSTAASRIEEAMKNRIGVSARVICLAAEELLAVIAENPLKEQSGADPSRLLVVFPSEPADLPRLEPLARRDWTPEILSVGSRAAYLWCPDGIRNSRLNEAVVRALGDAVTSRNWGTVMKLSALIEG